MQCNCHSRARVLTRNSIWQAACLILGMMQNTMKKNLRKSLGLASAYRLCEVLQKQGLCPLNVNTHFACVTGDAMLHDLGFRDAVGGCDLAQKIRRIAAHPKILLF